MKVSPAKTKEFRKNPIRLPGRKEFKLLEILWASSPLTVAEVLAVIPPGRVLAYTTVMTMLDQLFRKGLLQRVRRGRAFVYWPIFSREEVLAVLLKDFVQSYLAGNEGLLNTLSRAATIAGAAPAHGKRRESPAAAGANVPDLAVPAPPAEGRAAEHREPDQVEDFLL